MATPTLTTTNFSRVNACDSATGWSNLGGGGGSPSVSNDIFIEGLGSIGRRIDNTSIGFGYDLGSGTEDDFQPYGGAQEGDHIFFWVNILQPDLVNSMWVRGSSDSNPNPGDSIDYEIFTANDYNGGWYRGCIDPRNRYTVVQGTGWQEAILLNWQWYAFIFDMGDVGGGTPNCYIDAIDRGRGLIVTGGTTTDKITWADIAAVDQTNAYGLIQERSGIFFLLGEWQFGAATGDCYFEDTDQVVIWESRLSRDEDSPGNITHGISEDLNRLVLTEGTGTTDFISGVKVGTGNAAVGSNGVIYQVAPQVSGFDGHLTVDFSDADITNVELYDCTFRRCLSDGLTDISVIFSSDATNGPNHEVSGCLFDQCGLTDLAIVSAQNLEFSGSLQSSKYGTPLDALISWNDNLSEFQSATIPGNIQTREGNNGFVPLSAGSWAIDDELYFGFRDQFVGLEFSPIGVGGIGEDGDGVWEYYDGTTWSSLSGVVGTSPDSTSTSGLDPYGGTTDPTGFMGWEKVWTVPGDWEQTSVNSSPNLYFTRYRLTSTPASSTNSIWWIHALAPFNGAALLWNDDIDLVNANFSNNADADTNEKSHGVEHRVAGTYAYTTWTFSSNDADILFSDDTGNLIINANAGSNPTTSTILGTGTVTINTNVTVTLTGLIGSPATEVRVYDTGTTTELTGQENVTTGSFDISLDATDFVDIRIHNVEYVYISIINFDMPSTDASIPIQQRFDRNYLNP